jgi:hypothetical protein
MAMRARLTEVWQNCRMRLHVASPRAFALSLVLLLPVAALAADPTERLDVAQRGYDVSKASWKAGATDFTQVATWSKRLWEAQREADLATADADYVARMRELEAQAVTRIKAGAANQLEGLNAAWLRGEAEAAVKRKK